MLKLNNSVRAVAAGFVVYFACLGFFTMYPAPFAWVAMTTFVALAGLLGGLSERSR